MKGRSRFRPGPPPAPVHVLRTDEVGLTECGYLVNDPADLTTPTPWLVPGKGHAVWPEEPGSNCAPCLDAYMARCEGANA